MAHWYYGENGSQVGPLDEHAMRAAIGEGRVNQQTLVWRDGMPNWLPLASVPELSGANIYAPPGAAPAYYGPTTLPMGGRTSGLAIASLVCGITGVFACFPSIAAVICGHMALSSISKSPVPMAGRRMAITGLILGYIIVLCFAAVFIAGMFESMSR